jgi:translation initiation factor 2D
LVKPTDKTKVILDVTLCDALYKGAIKKGSAYPTEIHKKDLGSTFLNRMQVHHKVSRGTQEVIRKGAIRTIQIMTERRQGNKKMTRLSGLECFLMDPDSLASELQKKFACSTTTAELPGNLAYMATSLVHLLFLRKTSYGVKEILKYITSARPFQVRKGSARSWYKVE